MCTFKYSGHLDSTAAATSVQVSGMYNHITLTDQSTGLVACCKRYGDFSLLNLFNAVEWVLGVLPESVDVAIERKDTLNRFGDRNLLNIRRQGAS